MKKFPFLFLFLFSCFLSFANDPVYPFLKPQKGLIKIVDADNKKYVVTKNQLFEITHNKLRKIIDLPFVCNDATMYKGDIAMATDSGIVMYYVREDTAICRGGHRGFFDPG